MLCEKCGKNSATTHIRTVTNGVVREISLCSDCALKEGYTNNSLAGMLASMFSDVVHMGTEVQKKLCPVCKTDFETISKTGKMGCAECYQTFKNELLPYLKRVHGSTRHAGRVPNYAPLIVAPSKETVDSLRQELNRLVREENYEQAAVVRDKIKRMEEKGNE